MTKRIIAEGGVVEVNRPIIIRKGDRIATKDDILRIMNRKENGGTDD